MIALLLSRVFRALLAVSLFLALPGGFIFRAWSQPDYAVAHWNPPACTKYYTSGNTRQFCVIHDMEGYYLASISYLNRCDLDTNGNYNVSASIYYAVNGLKDGADEDGHAGDDANDAVPGDITQCVRESRYAWHARCWNTWMFGTEHEGFVTSPLWYTEAMYVSSAALQRHLCDVYGIPKDRNHIIGHNEWQNAAWKTWMTNNYPQIDPTCNTHTDPGVYWDWTHFMNLLNGWPAISNQPLSRMVEPGTNTSFTVTAAGTGPFFYQWRKNGTNIPNATTTSLALNNVSSNDAGSYLVIVTNTLASVTSRVATLTVTPAWTVAWADDFETNSAARWNFFWGAGNGIADYTTNWSYDYGTTTYVANGATNFIPPAPSGTGTRGLKITVNKNDTNQATVGVSLYPKSVAFSNNYVLKCDAWINYNGGIGGGMGSTEYGTFGVNHAGTRVNWNTTATSSDGLWFAVDGEGQSGGSDYQAFSGNGGAAPTLLTLANSGLAASGAAFNNHSDPFYQRLFPSPTYETSGAPGKHWVQVEVCQLGNVITWQINGLVVAQRTNTTSYTTGDVMIGYMDPFTSISSPLDQNYILFDNVRVMMPPIAPSITAQPSNQSTAQNANATFTVGAKGLPLSYQWRYNGNPIPGATQSAYTRTNAQYSDQGNYSVLITNSLGSIISSNATLNILPILQLKFGSAMLIAPSQFQMLLSGEPGTYQVFSSTNLVDWAPWTNIVITNNTAVFQDNASSDSQRFYRAAPAP